MEETSESLTAAAATVEAVQDVAAHVVKEIGGFAGIPLFFLPGFFSIVCGSIFRKEMKCRKIASQSSLKLLNETRR